MENSCAGKGNNEMEGVATPLWGSQICASYEVHRSRTRTIPCHHMAICDVARTQISVQSVLCIVETGLRTTRSTESKSRLLNNSRERYFASDG